MEMPYSSILNEVNENGVFECVNCGLTLFDAKAKYDSKTGWPSFSETIFPGIVGHSTGNETGHVRTEVHCARCGARLGHVYFDGPPPTGLRYCINGVALKFVSHAKSDNI